MLAGGNRQGTIRLLLGNGMQNNSTFFSILVFSGTLLFLSACSSDDESTSKSTGEASAKKRQSKGTPKEMELLVLAPPKLTLKEGIKNYATPTKPNMTDQEASQRLTAAAGHACSVGDNDTAELLLNEAIRLDDHNGEAYAQRGRARCNSVAGKDKAAIEDLKRAISLGCGGARVHITLARLYDATDQPLKAIEELGVASKLAPKEKDVYKSRAAVYAEIGQKEKALRDYEILTQLHPDDTEPHFRIAQILETMNRNEEARAHYVKVTELNDTGRVALKPICYKRLAVIDGARGKHEEAIKSWTEALKLDNTDDEPLRLRGLEYAMLKNYPKALADLNDAIKLSPDIRENFEARAELYDKMGQADRAKKDRLEADKLNARPAERPVYDWKKPADASN